MDKDLRARLLAAHLANASDTSRPLSRPEGGPGVFDGLWGLVKGVFWGACAWAILGAVYLMLTVGG
jgi:hypothetical protein